jgi:hypothetical protein
MKGKTELIKNLEGFGKIKPRKDWVILTKKEILGDSEAPSFSFRGTFSFLSSKYRSATVMLVVVGALMGTFGFAQTALPGDNLYVLKKATERARIALAPENERTNLQLSYANEKLENLVRITQANQVRKIAPIIDEYQGNLVRAAESLDRAEERDAEKVRSIVKKTREIEENKRKVEALGVVVENTEEFDNALAQMVEREIKELEKKVLLEEQKELLERIKEDFQEGEYSQALENILLLSYPQDK